MVRFVAFVPGKYEDVIQELVGSGEPFGAVVHGLRAGERERPGSGIAHR